MGTQVMGLPSLRKLGCFCRGAVASLPAACGVGGAGGGGGAGRRGRCRGYQGSWQDTGHVAGAGWRGGHRAVSGEQVAAHLGGRAAAPRTSALRAWPWGHGGCRGHRAGGAGGPGLPGLGASLRRAQVCGDTGTAEARLWGRLAQLPTQGSARGTLQTCPAPAALPPARPQSSSRHL